MAKLNLQVNTISYSDINPSNNPNIRSFDLQYKLLGVDSSNPKSEEFSVAPGETRTIFNGVRSTAIDNTTAFTISRPDISLNIYRFTNSSGTPPALRTDRLPGVDNTSQFTVSVNGPLSTYTSSGGTLLNTTNIIVGDILKIDTGAGFSQSNSGRFVILSKTSTSITVQNLNAITEAITLSDYTQFLIYSNGGSNNQTQINDKVIISGGFSPATQGTYTITEVTPNYFEVAAANPMGLPIETNVIVGSSGVIFYSSAKQFVMIAAQQKCSVQNNADTSDNTILEPIVVNNPEKPALYIKNGTTYALSIKNLSLDTLDVVVASAE